MAGQQAVEGPGIVSFVGTNVRTELKGNTLLIIVPDVNLTFGASASGKSETVATSHGIKPLVRLPSGQIIRCGVNLFITKPVDPNAAPGS